MINKIEGLVAAPFTPMYSDGSLNLEIIPEYAAFLEYNGISGAFISGSTGEGVSLSFNEKCRLIEAWGKAPAGAIKKIALVGGTSIAEAVELAKIAENLKYEAVAVVAPYYFVPSNTDVLLEFCVQIGEAVPKIGLYYYHIPALTGYGGDMYSFLQQIDGRLPNFRGIKYTHEDLMDYKLCLEYKNRKYDLLWGRDEVFLSALAIGAKGAVGSTFNYAAPLYYKLIDAFNKGDLKEANTMQYKSIEIVQTLKKYGGMAAGKAFMKAVGIDCGNFRIPVRGFIESDFEQFMAHLQQIDFFTAASKAKLELHKADLSQ